MTIQSACTFNCLKCSDHTVLPRRSHLGRFDDQSSPSKDIWPIRYLCLYCGQSFEVLEGMIHRASVEMQDRYQLVRYDFSSDQSGTLRHVAIYTKELKPHIEDNTIAKVHDSEAIGRVLNPSGLWDSTWGDKLHVSIDRGCEKPIPATLKSHS